MGSTVQAGQEVKLSYMSANGVTVVVPGVLVEITADGCSIDLEHFQI